MEVGHNVQGDQPLCVPGVVTAVLGMCLKWTKVTNCPKSKVNTAGGVDQKGNLVAVRRNEASNSWGKGRVPEPG